MKDPQRRSYPNAAAISRHPRLIMSTAISIGILLAFILSACSRDAVVSPSSVPSSSIPTLTQTSQVATTTNYPIKVFFSKSPQSLNTNFTAVYPVDRSSPTLALGNFAIQLLIAGPTPAEQQAGYFTELNTMLSGPSKCTALPVGGPDFTLTMDMKGLVTEKGTATLKFCRSLSSAGIGADARVQAEIDITLKQFATIKKVIILLEGGDCFGDMSGQNLCLN
jgi:hypothetical protein